MTRPLRSWLYVPGNRPELIGKAARGEADAIVIDLEDSVPAQAKDAARETVRAVFDDRPRKPIWVRINDVRGPWGEADMTALAGLPLSGVRLPKCEDPEVVRSAGHRLGLPLHLLLESAVGIERAMELARAHPDVSGIGLGEADLAADLRTTADTTLAWCRARVVVAARSAGLPAPVQSVWTDVRDLDGLRASSEHARDAGFFGRSVIHPGQVAIVNEVFTPDDRQVRNARELVGALTTAAAGGRSAFIDDEGRFVDPAVVEQARWMLTLAEQLGSVDRQAGVADTTGRCGGD
jgi:citrate lyase subunit beta / citryl-CoA lyase